MPIAWPNVSINFDWALQSIGILSVQYSKDHPSLIWNFVWDSARPEQRIHQRRNKRLERPTSNVQHRTLNNDDATLYRFYNKRTAACDEPFGREPFGGELKVERLLVEKLRVERLSRIEIRSVDSLPVFVATLAEQANSVFLKLTEYIIRSAAGGFDVGRSFFSKTHIRNFTLSFFNDQTGRFSGQRFCWTLNTEHWTLKLPESCRSGCAAGVTWQSAGGAAQKICQGTRFARTLTYFKAVQIAPWDALIQLFVIKFKISGLQVSALAFLAPHMRH